MNEALLEQLKKIVRDSEIMREDDHSWPPPDKVGRQELEVVMDGEVSVRVCVPVCLCLCLFVFVLSVSLYVAACRPMCPCLCVHSLLFLSFLAIPERQYNDEYIYVYTHTHTHLHTHAHTHIHTCMYMYGVTAHLIHYHQNWISVGCRGLC